MTRTAGNSDHRVTIIVPTYRDWARMALCLQSLAAQTYPASLVEILVVNNEPSDPPPHDLCAPANCRILDEPKKGSYAARNAAVKEATGDIVLFTDSDCRPEPDWCAQAVAFLATHKEVRRMGGDIRLGTNEGPTTVADVYESAFAFPIRKYVGRGWAPTANMGVWRDTFDRVGTFQDGFYSGGDGEWGRRAQQHGFPIGYCPEAVVTHPARSLSDILRKRRRISGARLRRRIEEHGRLPEMIGFVFRALRRLLPPTSPVKHLVRLKSAPIRLRWAAYFFIYYLRLDNEVTRARILFLNAEPEHR